MKKIMFKDRYSLTKAVLEGRKTQTRRIPDIQPPYKNSEIAFPIFEDDGIDSPLWMAYCWVNKDNPNEHTEWIKPQYREDEKVAIAQSYKDCGGLMEDGTPRWDFITKVVGAKNRGWSNKMFVKPELMPNRIRITRLRLQRLQDISDNDCLAEGIEFDGKAQSFYCGMNISTNAKNWLGCTPREAYAALIDKINGKGTWESNPYVFVYEFELVK